MAKTAAVRWTVVAGRSFPSAKRSATADARLRLAFAALRSEW